MAAVNICSDFRVQEEEIRHCFHLIPFYLPWVFTGKTDAKAETPILWPRDGKSELTGKDPDAGKD